MLKLTEKQQVLRQDFKKIAQALQDEANTATISRMSFLTDSFATATYAIEKEQTRLAQEIKTPGTNILQAEFRWAYSRT